MKKKGNRHEAIRRFLSSPNRRSIYGGRPSWCVIVLKTVLAKLLNYDRAYCRLLLSHGNR